MSNITYKKRILAVDDTAVVLTRILYTLQDAYDVITINSGERALKYLKENKPDLILLDIRMSPMDGIETLQSIRTMEECKDIPVIMLTGVEDKDVVIKSAKLGICDYIRKPFSSEELIRRIRRVFDQENQKQAEKERKQAEEERKQVEEEQKQAEE